MFSGFLFCVCGKGDGCGCWVTFCNLAVNKLRVMAHKGGLSAGLSGYVGQGFETCVLVCARQ